jgi:nitroimidazol reductase NimA-like FMN-containing flavoprotein (pyridoxamine 5'-phosphate oxidase superfamily)
MDTALFLAEDSSPTECYRLLGSVRVGRVVMTRQALPVVLPVAFALDGHTIVIATAVGSPLAAASAQQAVVAFEADDLDPVTLSGWSVVVTGTISAVTDPRSVVRAAQFPLVSGAGDELPHFVCIAPGLISGRYMRKNAV